MTSNLQSKIQANTTAYIEELSEFLRIPSISTDPEHKDDIQRGAEWLHTKFKAMNASSTEIHPTAGHPIVTAHFGNDPLKPTILVYGHYDVQPPGNEAEWITPAFKPTIRDGNIYARGATDDKGQVFMHLKALELLQEQGELPCNMIYLIEGEEEVGSKSLPQFVAEHKEMLKCDTILISDTAMIDKDTPAITVGLRGATLVNVTVIGPDHDLHSGTYGGAVANPIEGLSHIIAGMVDKDGRITIPGFYDGIKELNEKERTLVNGKPFNEEAYKKSVGVETLGIREAGYTVTECTGSRPSFTVNSIHAGAPVGQQGLIIASQVHATMSLRLVPGQDHTTMGARLDEHLKSLAPAGIKVECQPVLSAAAWAKESFENADYQTAANAYETVWGVKPIPTFNGGSIPIVPVMQKELGVAPVLMGFGLSSDLYHSPNEHLGLDRFTKGIEAIALFINNYPTAYAEEKKNLELNP